MQFKHPEILFALFLLLIPIFIHLFQLRRFQKAVFTNVAFLKKIIVQTRKSSQLKKWLTLLMRLLAITCLVLAFAQPFIPNHSKTKGDPEVVFYIDNSFSMQASGRHGEILERTLQELYEKVSGENISWFTNDSERKNASIEDFKSEILRIRPSFHSLSPDQVLIKSERLFSKEKTGPKKLIYLSDFQEKEDFPEVPKEMEVHAVHLKPVTDSNLSVDSVFVKSKTGSSLQLQANLSKQGKSPEDIPVSLYKNSDLIVKAGVSFSPDSKAEILFDVDVSEDFTGKVSIEDPNIPFDNDLFISINKPERIRILSLNEGPSDFISRIFNEEEFNLTHFQANQIDYSKIGDQDFIILNQLKEIPVSLSNSLIAFKENGGTILIIPSEALQLNSYNQFLNDLRIGNLNSKQQKEKKITGINFSHPLYEGVFEKEISNFQYPKVNSFYGFSTSGSPVLFFEDRSPFLVQIEKVFLFTAPIDLKNSNFLNSPLVVPTLFNMGIQSLPLPKLYYIIGEENRFAVPVKLGSDEILSIRKDEEVLIPLQQTKSNHVEISISDDPSKSGNYQVIQKDKVLQHISLNYDRKEGILRYKDPSEWDGIYVYKNIPSLFSDGLESKSVKTLWKWLLIFALLFLIAEMLILKFIGNRRIQTKHNLRT